MAKITFLGAAGTVTGSKYLLEAAGKRLLVDCGLFQGSKELQQRNWNPLTVDPATLDWVLLTHAHIDHTGYLPRLVAAGYRGPVYADAATHELCNLLLPDSAHLQEEDAQFAARKGYSSHKQPLPLYTVSQAQQALARFQEIPREDLFTISPEFSVRTHDAGHILGSTWLELTITENGKKTLVVFSGDIGRYDQVILKDPEPPTRADYLLCESTYGDREHGTASVPDALADVINRVAKRGGVVVIPSFAVGRTQTLMYYLRELDDAQRIPKVPVYVDSPMAISVTDIYARHHEDHDLDFTKLEQQGDRDPLNFHDVHMTRAVEDSKKINDVTSPCIIISASGMATGGRVLHHLAKRLPDSRSAVMLVGYQAAATLGRALQDGAQYVRIHGQEVPVRAEIVVLDQLSAHAGRSELLRWLSGFTAPPRQTFLVHGEPSGLEGLRAGIASRFHWPVLVPAYLQSFDLNT
jgi:metallo-beta-lactamase family protein